jgi:hypothetical protein
VAGLPTVEVVAAEDYDREVNDLRDQVQMYEEKAERDWRDFGEMQDARIAADDRVVELEKELARVCKQLDSANDMVERAWSLTAGAMSGNPHKPTANSEWMDAAHAWEIDYCMGAGLSGKTSDEKTEPEPHESERIAELAAREAEPNPYRSQDQIVRDQERTRILALLDSVEAEEAVVNALMAAVDAGADLGSEARAAITALVGLVERGVPNG